MYNKLNNYTVVVVVQTHLSMCITTNNRYIQSVHVCTLCRYKYSILTGVMQLLSKCSESGLRGGSSQPLSRRSCRILLMSSNFSLHNIHIDVDV